ncbi:MFS transporter [Limisalsivibrio acetivorans]|uniref:MFS transporter n=1 Tax=Limisalsivibrio acetivorans TaxID=1304888 RepID=UPI0003B5A2D4|nr:MFS transporter [Limisalsivibrio acetivorans]
MASFSGRRLSANLNIVRGYALLFGVRAYIPVLFLHYRNLGYSFTEISFLTSGFFIGMLALELPSGVMADKLGRRFSMVFASIILTAGTLMTGYGGNFAVLWLGVFLVGASEACVSGSDEALIYDTLKIMGREGEFNKFFGSKWAFYTFGYVIGSLFMTMVYGYGMKSVFAFSAVFSAISGVVALFLYEPESTEREHLPGHFRHFWETGLYILRSKELVLLMALHVSILIANQVFFQYHQFFMEESGIEVAMFGVVYAGGLFISGVSANYSHIVENNLGGQKLLRLLILLPAVSFLGIVLNTSAFMVILAFILCEAAFGFALPFFNRLFNDRVHSHHRATAVSIRSFADSVSIASAVPFFGLITDSQGLRPTALALFLFVVLLAWPSLRAFASVTKSELLRKGSS